MATSDSSHERSIGSAEAEAAGAARRVDRRRSAKRSVSPAVAHRRSRRGQPARRRPVRTGSGADWEALIRAYHRLTQVFLAQPGVPPVDELEAFSTLAHRSRLSAHELVALHYAVLNGLLESGETHAAEGSGAPRLALTSVLLRLMGEYRREGGGVAPGTAGP